MSSKIITQGLRFILVLMLIYVLFEVLYSDAAQLTVPSDVRTQTMILNPQTPACTPPCACTANEEGRIFYNDNDNKLYYCDGVNWKILDPEKTVATKIVSAYNSSGATDGINPCLGDGSTCNNPKADYTCDGTDDQVKINRAINSLPIDLNGVSYGVVYLLEGTYNISTALEDGDLPASGETVAGIIPHSNTAIIGTGRGTVLKVVSGAINVNVINASTVNRILISQLMIDGNNKTGSLNRGIYFNVVTYSKIDKVWVENMAWAGITLDYSSNNIITNNNVQGNTQSGIYLYRSSNIISGNNVQSNQEGIYLNNSSNNIITNNNVQGNSSYGLCLNVTSNNNIISGNNVQSNQQGIYLANSSSNNTISHNIEGNNSNQDITLKDSSNNTISNNNLQHTTVYNRNNIVISSSSNNTIIGNLIYNTNAGSGAYDGIRLDETISSNNIISSNRLYDSTRTGYGINISTNTCDNNYLVGNLIDGLGYIDSAIPPTYDRRIQDLGTGTKYTDKAKLTFERAPSQDPGAGGMINATYTYIPLNPSSTYTLNATTAITDGKSAGDLLILENINATNSITIPNGANTRLSIDGFPGPIPLSGNDTLSLIWNGNGTAGVGDWVEIGYADN